MTKEYDAVKWPGLFNRACTAIMGCLSCISASSPGLAWSTSNICDRIWEKWSLRAKRLFYHFSKCHHAKAFRALGFPL